MVPARIEPVSLGFSVSPCSAISTLREIQTTRPQNASSAASAPIGPNSRISDVPGMFGTPVISGSLSQNRGMCAVAQTDPRTKNVSTISIRLDPPPVVNSVPEAHPPPSCMPMPKTNAPSAEASPIGITTGCMFQPVTGPRTRSARYVTAQVIANNAICARRPAPRRSRVIRRHAAVKPNEAW